MDIDRQPSRIALRDVVAAWAVCLALAAAGLLYPELEGGEKLSVEARAAALAGPSEATLPKSNEAVLVGSTEAPLVERHEPPTGGTAGPPTTLCAIGKAPAGQLAGQHGG